MKEKMTWWTAAVSTMLVWHVGFRSYDLKGRNARYNQGFRVNGVYKGEKIENYADSSRPEESQYLTVCFPRWRWGQVRVVRHYSTR